jgi:4-amino-4-deoxy-L-arabinose transferase-like glycosyltransferase
VRAGSIATIAVCALLLATFAATAARACRDKSATYDEPLHLVSSYLQTRSSDFRSDPDNPPLWKYYVAAAADSENVVLPKGKLWDEMLHDFPSQNQYCSDILYRTAGNNPDALIRAARFRMIFLGVLLGATIAFWAWRLGGAVAAVVATAFFSLDPNFLAHSPLIKNDVPITLIFLWLMMGIWLLGRRVTALRCLAVALTVGAALTTKFSGFFAIPILAVALLVRALSPTPWPIFRLIATKRVHRLVAAIAIGAFSLIISYATIWAACQFRFTNGPEKNSIASFRDVMTLCALSQYFQDHPPLWDAPAREVQQSAAMQSWMAQWRPDAVIRSTLWLNSHRLFPQTYLRGFLFTYGSTMYRGTFLCGQINFTGWWYYFPLAMLFKTPLATLIALLLAFIVSFHFWRQANPWNLFSFLLFPICYMAISMYSALNIGLRHVLPVYPFLFILLGVIAAHVSRRRPRIARPIILVLLLGLAAETFCAYPNFLPFFNIAAGGSRGGVALLSDSNIDWGQELPDLAEWQGQHPDRQLYLYYFGSADPRYYHIHYMNLPGSFAPPDQSQPNCKPASYAVSAIALQGVMDPDDFKFYAQLKKTNPTAILGGSMYIFDAP